MTVRTRPSAKRCDEQGLTLVEMMVGVLLFTMLSAGAFMVLSGQQRSDHTQQRSSTALDNARLTLNTIANQLRVAKAGMPDGVGLNRNDTLPPGPNNDPMECPTGSGVVPAIQVIDGGDNGSDRLRIIYPDGGAWGTLVNAVAPVDASVTVRTPDDLPPPLAPTDWGMLTNFDRAVLFRYLSPGFSCTGGHCLLKVTSTSWLGGSMTDIPAGRTLLRARWVEYDIQHMELGSTEMQVAATGRLPALTATALTPFSLLDTTQPAALGIEDLQVALGVDWRVPSDGVIEPENAGAADADEWIHNVSGESLTATASTLCDLAQVIAIRISVVARTTSRDHAAKTHRPKLENHTAGPVDGYHRVVLTTVVGLRH